MPGPMLPSSSQPGAPLNTQQSTAESLDPANDPANKPIGIQTAFKRRQADREYCSAFCTPECNMMNRQNTNHANSPRSARVSRPEVRILHRRIDSAQVEQKEMACFQASP